MRLTKKTIKNIFKDLKDEARDQNIYFSVTVIIFRGF